ncbi:hypothetical protein NW768_012175 [Fusarium equiseti]|uniref:Heterokaryon incompatibility domain-containing protein n=1 Tax=Fusarium equiseti TaxID=61235 RepID=A0ABQ8QV38_FUSEQ|nr:hypothetical protein NW768_012175 [Fusarium equiseti]
MAEADCLQCIPQKDKDPKKQELLGMMGDIYSQAKFTIVAAAGLDCNHGLVGVTRPRKPELRYTNVPGAKLTYLGTPPAEKIRSILWASRGWTYQEGFLSHRRIFFTDEQVMFQCNAMICLESFEGPMSDLHQPNKPKGRRNHFLVDIEPVNLAYKDIGKHLEEFSNRNLTKDSDTLKAFLGILDFFRTDNECFHFYGNPISIRKEKVHYINAWYHTKPGVRIAEFPSWSWAGWKGGVKMTSRDHPEYDLRMFRTRKRAEHPAEHPAGHPMSLDEYKEACSTNHPQNMEPVIELTGMMAKMSFEVIKWNSKAVGPDEGDNKILMQDGAWAMLPFTDNDTYHSFLYLDNEALTGICQFKLPVMVLESGKEKTDQSIVILVLREIGVYRFERVGMIILWRKENEDKAKLTMCRDKSGKWKRVQPESIPKLQKFTWWKELSDQRITLQ